MIDYESWGKRLLKKLGIKKKPQNEKPNMEFATVPIDLAHKDFLSSVELRVYIILSRMANDKIYCWPSQEEISKMIGYSRKQVNKAIKSLYNKGIIHKETLKKTNNQETNIYLVKYHINVSESDTFFSNKLDQKFSQLDQKFSQLDQKFHQVGPKVPPGRTKRLQEDKEIRQGSKSSSKKDTTTVNLDNLEESKGTNGAALLYSWQYFLHDLPLRSADINNLDKIKVDDWLLHHITLWPRFLYKTDDEYIRQSDGSLSVLINNLSKFKHFVEHDSLRYVDYVNKENTFKRAVASAKDFQSNMNKELEVIEDERDKTRFTKHI